MKADLPLDERRRLERGREKEIRDALVRRHFDLAEEQQLIDVALLDHNLRLCARAMAVLNGSTPAYPRLTDGAAPAVVAPPAPSAPSVVITEREKPDTLRTKLGLS